MAESSERIIYHPPELIDFPGSFSALVDQTGERFLSDPGIGMLEDAVFQNDQGRKWLLDDDSLERLVEEAKTFVSESVIKIPLSFCGENHVFVRTAVVWAARKRFRGVVEREVFNLRSSFQQLLGPAAFIDRFGETMENWRAVRDEKRAAFGEVLFYSLESCDINDGNFIVRIADDSQFIIEVSQQTWDVVLPREEYTKLDGWGFYSRGLDVYGPYLIFAKEAVENSPGFADFVYLDLETAIFLASIRRKYQLAVDFDGLIPLRLEQAISQSLGRVKRGNS